MGEHEGVDRLAAAVLQAADRALDRGEWEAAADLARQVLDVRPGDERATGIVAVAAAQGRTGASDQGRRYLTVLFSDIVGSTPLSDRLDPEDYLAVVAAYRDVVREAVHRNDGHIDQFQGDGVVAYFGFPSPAEDDQVRAVEAGLEIVERVPTAVGAVGVEIESRVGIHVGRTVMTSAELGRRDQSAAIGFAANVAAKVQAGAPAGAVVVSAAAVDAVARHFEVEPIGDRAVGGTDGALAVYVVRGRRAPRGADEPVVPLVGRDEERERIEEAWAAAAHGDTGAARLVVLVGEPGIGKSRLARHAAATAAAAGGAVVEIGCRQGLRRTSLGALRRAFASVPPLLEPLLDEGAHAGVAPDLRREAIVDGLVAWVSGEAASVPTLLVVEDVHWADDTTIEVLRRLASGRLPDGLAVVLTCRSGSVPAPLAGVAADAIELAPLGDEAIVDLVRTLAAGTTLDGDAVDALARRCEGVPLFAEHLVAAATSGVDAALPSTIEGVLQVRLDATGVGRGVAEVASTFGREFTAELVHVACEDLGDAAPVDPEAVDEGLRALERARLVEPHGVGGLRFRHSLVRDAAYELQLRADRARRHAAAAAALVATMGHEVPRGVLAHHHERAGATEPAAALYLDAAREAADVAEYDLALEHLRAARSLIDHVGGLPGRRLELAWCMQQSAVVMAASTWAATEVDALMQRALELCDSLADDLGPSHELDVQVAAALAGSWIFATVQGDVHAARGVTDRVEKLAATAPPELERDLRVFITAGRGIELFYAGANDDTIALLADFQVGDERSRPIEHGAPHEPATATVSVYGAALAVRGDDEAANVAIARALEACRQLPFPIGPFTEDLVLIYAAYAHRLAGDLEEARRAAARIVANGERHGFREHVMLGHVLGFTAGALAGDTSACHALQASLDLWRSSTGGGLGVPLLLSELAAGWLLIGDVAAARRAVDEGIALQEPTGQWGTEPELRRIAALVDHAEGAPVEAVVESLVLAARLAVDRGAHRFAARALRDVARLTGGGLEGAAAELGGTVVAAVPALARELAP